MRNLTLLLTLSLLACGGGEPSSEDPTPEPANGRYLDVGDLGVSTDLLASCEPAAGQCNEYWGIVSDLSVQRYQGLRVCHHDLKVHPRCELTDSFLGVCVVDTEEGLSVPQIALPASSTWLMYRFREVIYTFPPGVARAGEQIWESEENSKTVCEKGAFGRWVPAADTKMLP